MMVGHRFILEEFGEEAIPRVGWHLDSFGHSKTNMRLLAELGYDSVFGARIDYKERKYRKEMHTREFIWKPSNDTEIFYHAMTGHYSSPRFLKFEHQSD